MRCSSFLNPITAGVNEMQTLANLSSSRDVLRQVEINNGALARLEGYFANYKEALKYQLDQKKPELLEALNPSSSSPVSSPNPSGSNSGKGSARRVPSASFMAGSSTPPPPGDNSPMRAHSATIVGASTAVGGMRRRKSLRESIGGDQMMNTVNTLAAKVVSSNDRYSYNSSSSS